MSKKNPQENTFHIVVNSAQLAHIISGLQAQIATLPVDEVGDTIDEEFDTADTFYCYPADTLEMLVDLQKENADDRIVHGLCL